MNVPTCGVFPLRRAGGPVLALLLVAGSLQAQQTVSGGTGNDYQADVAIPWDAPQARIVVFERLDAGQSGDLYVTRSSDAGATWTAPVLAIGTAANERHPALVQTGAQAWALFHLAGTGATSSFRIHRATSTDGTVFTAQGAVDLGWATGGEVNPHVVRHPDGTLAMTYQRLSGASYIALSADDGATWDTLRTQVSPGNAALPRIVFRPSDGTWLLVYQTGSNPVSAWIRTSADPYDWSAPARPLEPAGNNHDGFPMVLSDDSFAVLWAQATGSAFQVFSIRSRDGIAWEPAIQVSDRPGLHNVQPHALRGPDAGTAEIYWGAGQVPGYANLDIVREPAVLLAPAIFADGFE